MYRKIVTLALFAVICGLNSPAFAIDNEATPGVSITLSDNATIPKTLTLNFSPSVAARYETSGAAVNNEQDYTLGTYHVGGVYFYGTSSAETSIYKKTRTTDMTFASAGYVDPVPPEIVEGEVVTPGVDAVVSPWTAADSGWTK